MVHIEMDHFFGCNMQIVKVVDNSLISVGTVLHEVGSVKLTTISNHWKQALRREACASVSLGMENRLKLVKVT